MSPRNLALAAPLIAAVLCSGAAARAADSALESFNRDAEPILEQYCYDCHGDGSKKGGVHFDEFKTDADVRDHALWLRVMKNVRAGIMPPATEPRVPSEDEKKLMTWIKLQAFSLDPAHPDPGRVTLRRLNRVEYRNTVRALTGVKYDTQLEFPADDTGQGFDNIGDVLTISPMLLERYLDSAQAIIAEAVPTQAKSVAVKVLPGRLFAGSLAAVPEKAAPSVAAAPPAGAVVVAEADTSKAPPEVTGVSAPPVPAAADPAKSSPEVAAPAAAAGPAAQAALADPEDPTAKAPEAPLVFKRPPPKVEYDGLDLSYYTPAVVSTSYKAVHAGKYQVGVKLVAKESYVDDQFDLNRCRLLFRVDGEALISQEFVRESDKDFEFSFDRDWQPGEHTMSFEVQPIGPERAQLRNLRIRVSAVEVRGPMAQEYWVQPDRYARFFPKNVPWWAPSRRKYAADLLTEFATRAFRRPVDDATVQRLVAMAESASSQPDGTFESGIAQAMVAVLASPRFIFRTEDVEPLKPGQVDPYIDEYALASRLSYFFWSSMPDDELFRLAAKGQLRANLPAQVDRMLADPRSSEFVSNFTGQWLEARDVENVQINPYAVYLREHPNKDAEDALATFQRVNQIAVDKRTEEEKADLKRARATFQALLKLPKAQLNGPIREAMRKETEMDFAYIIKEDRSLLELIECDYTFLNEDLAKHYGIPGVTGKEMRKVMLPPDSPRGGVLTQGTMLTVTSNPTRTSPVKRGVFILDAILGTRPPPPPPNIPALEDAASPEKLRTMTLRENLALHASNKTCAACHSRMDPLGLALENFNAMGMWRDGELNRPIDAGGKLITGEKFANVRELKHILATKHRRDFYYCFTQKLMTYALGRTLDYYDMDTVDLLVAQLEASGGRPSVLLHGIVNSAAFEQRRSSQHEEMAESAAAPPPDRLTQQ